MPLLFSPVCSPTLLLQLQSFFYYLEFPWGCVPPPLSCGVCYVLAAFSSLPLPKHTGKVLPLLPSSAGLFIYRLCEGLPFSHSSMLCFSHFYKPSPLQVHWVGRCCHSYLLLLACLFTIRVGIAHPLHSPEFRALCPLY
jgi:hypothetical protein